MGVEVDNPSPWHQGNAGMTLLELVMVLTIVTVVSVVAMVKFFGNDEATGGQSALCQEPPQSYVAYCLTEDLRNAQMKAMLVAPGYSIVHANGQPSYYNKLDADGTLLGQVGTVPQGITVSPFTVSFDGLGRPLWSGDITITKTLDVSPFLSTIGVVHVENNTGAVWVTPNG